MDNQVTVIKNALSACPIDRDRLVVGTEEGLYSVDLDRDGKLISWIVRLFQYLSDCSLYRNKLVVNN